jgi:hypothetical protein
MADSPDHRQAVPSSMAHSVGGTGELLGDPGAECVQAGGDSPRYGWRSSKRNVVSSRDSGRRQCPGWSDPYRL